MSHLICSTNFVPILEQYSVCNQNDSQKKLVYSISLLLMERRSDLERVREHS